MVLNIGGGHKASNQEDSDAKIRLHEIKSIDVNEDTKSSELSEIVDDFLDRNSEENDDLVNVRREIFLA